MTATTTTYNGCAFKSAGEARWAVFFDALGLPWEYEPDGYVTSPGPHRPFFWLPDLELWLEVKPHRPTEADRRFCEKLADVTDYPVARGQDLIRGSFQGRYIRSTRAQPGPGGPGWPWNRCGPVAS